MNIEMLRKEFEEILVHEERARHFYDHYMEQLREGKIKDQLISIRNDEIVHINIAKELIKMVS